jgi:hypothetical protein
MSQVIFSAPDLLPTYIPHLSVLTRALLANKVTLYVVYQPGRCVLHKIQINSRRGISTSGGFLTQL